MTTQKDNQLKFHALIAYENLETVIFDADERMRAALALASCAIVDTSRRMAFREQYAHITNRSRGFIVASEYPLDPLAGGIIDIHKKVALNLDEVKTSPLWNGKDVSVELAATSQLGDWDKGDGLDDELRALPESSLLAENGLTFTDVFNDPSESRLISYRFADSNGQLLVRRTSPAGDVSHSDTTEIDVVKQSQFVVDESRLSTTASEEARKSAQQYEKVKKDKDLNPDQRLAKQRELKRLMAEIGLEIIEPHLLDSKMRNKDVLPVSSQYFALYRSKK